MDFDEDTKENDDNVVVHSESSINIKESDTLSEVPTTTFSKEPSKDTIKPSIASKLDKFKLVKSQPEQKQQEEEMATQQEESV